MFHIFFVHDDFSPIFRSFAHFLLNGDWNRLRSKSAFASEFVLPDQWFDAHSIATFMHFSGCVLKKLPMTARYNRLKIGAIEKLWDCVIYTRAFVRSKQFGWRSIVQTIIHCLVWVTYVWLVFLGAGPSVSIVICDVSLTCVESIYDHFAIVNR